MWNAIVEGQMPDFWPPRPNRFWRFALEPFRKLYLRHYHRIAEVQADGAEKVWKGIGPYDGVLIAPNHSHDSDPHVMMEVGKRVNRPMHFIAAWQIFRMHWGIDGWLRQRMGAFSIDRESCDRRAIRQAVDLLTRRESLVVFPEGEVYRLNDRLTPLLEGVAFMALSAQKELERGTTGARVWVVPAAIRYRYLEDIRPQLIAAMDRLEARFLWKPQRRPLPERIIRYGEMLLTLKETERLGRTLETEGDLPTRIQWFINYLLSRMETEYLKKSPSASPSIQTVPLRIKALRRKLLDIVMDEAADENAKSPARLALDEVQLALQLYSYPGDYLSEDPCVERMAETIEKFEEDIDGYARPKGRRRARVLFGEPIDLKSGLNTGRTRTIATDITNRLEMAIQDLMRSEPR